MTAPDPTAALLVIGNEILSGRTQDQNLNYIACGLAKIGVRFMEARVVPDIPAQIIAAVNALREQYSYVFTTGGIGPTHDDITTECIAAAFSLPMEYHEGALARLLAFYDQDEAKMTAPRRRMARVPQGAVLIDNPISAAPGYRIGNVFVMAGIPAIMQAMFDSVKEGLEHGRVVLSEEIRAYVSESRIAEGLSAIQDKYPDTEIGSYPFSEEGRYGTHIVIRCTEKQRLAAAAAEISALLDSAPLL